MDDFEKRIRRDALKLIACGFAAGLLIGLLPGAYIASRNIDRVVVVPLDVGIDV